MKEHKTTYSLAKKVKLETDEAFGFICKLREIQRRTYYSHQEYTVSKMQDERNSTGPTA